MTSDKQTPKVRFKGCEQGWKEKKLSDIGEFSKGRGYSKKHLAKSGCPIILYGRLYTKYQAAIKDVDTFVTPQKDSIYSKGNEVIIPSSGETAEDISRASAVLHPGIILGGDLNIISLPGNISPIFLALGISHGKSKKELSKRAQGKSVVHLYNSDLRTVNCYHPCLTEQIKIGNYFEELDVLIQGRTQKLEKIGNLRQAMLKKMFPKDNADTPEIRFKGFVDKWRKKKLGEELDISSASRVHKSEWTVSGVPFFRSSDVVSAYKGQDNTRAYISYDLYRKLSSISGSVRKSDILITGGGSIGIPYLIKSDDPLYFKDADLLWLKNTGNVDGYFLYTFFLTHIFRNYIKGITHTGTISHYTIEQAKSTPIYLPDYLEQQQIGRYFQRLDQLIHQSLQSIEQLKHLKQAMLQKMFI